MFFVSLPSVIRGWTLISDVYDKNKSKFLRNKKFQIDIPVSTILWLKMYVNGEELRGATNKTKMLLWIPIVISPVILAVYRNANFAHVRSHLRRGRVGRVLKVFLPKHWPTAAIANTFYCVIRWRNISEEDWQNIKIITWKLSLNRFNWRSTWVCPRGARGKLFL